MIKAKHLALVAALVALCAWSTVAAAEWTAIGNHPFCRPPLESQDQLRDLALSEKRDLQKGFADAGYAHLYQEFERQVETAEVNQVTVQPGEKLRFMLYRTKGKGPVKVAKEVTWRGKEAFQAYRFDVDHEGRRYEFLVPKGCGNFALRNISAVPAAPVTTKTEPAPTNQRPQCRLTLSSQELRCGSTVLADAGASSDPDGRVAAVVFQLLDPAGKVVWENTVSQPPFQQEIAVPCDFETYRIKAVAIDDQGDRSVNPECSRTIKATRLVGGPVVDFGYARVFDPADFVFGRVGYEIPLVDKLHLRGMVGGFWKVAGCAADSSVVVDLMLDYHWLGPFSLGFGAGYWSGDDGQLDLIGNLGIKLWDHPQGFNTSLFLEARSATDELDELADLGRYGIGLRVRF
jgi:hypothetical protein